MLVEEAQDVQTLFSFLGSFNGVVAAKVTCLGELGLGCDEE